MTARTARATCTRVLDPLERFWEIVFGLIMVRSFTCAISVAEAGREDVRAMFIGAIRCNFAGGIIDAAFYPIACLTADGRHAALLRHVQQSRDPAQARATPRRGVRGKDRRSVAAAPTSGAIKLT